MMRAEHSQTVLCPDHVWFRLPGSLRWAGGVHLHRWAQEPGQVDSRTRRRSRMQKEVLDEPGADSGCQ